MTKEAAQEVLKEYIKVAATLLQDEYGDEYSPNAVAQLADHLITQDQEAALDKEAALIRQFAFEQELSKTSASVMDTISKVKDFYTTHGANAIGMGSVGKVRAAAGRMVEGASKTEAMSFALKKQLKGAAVVGGTALGAGVGASMVTGDKN